MAYLCRYSKCYCDCSTFDRSASFLMSTFTAGSNWNARLICNHTTMSPNDCFRLDSKLHLHEAEQRVSVIFLKQKRKETFCGLICNDILKSIGIINHFLCIDLLKKKFPRRGGLSVTQKLICIANILLDLMNCFFFAIMTNALYD